MSYKTNRRTRTKFMSRAPIVEDIQVTRIGPALRPTTVIPWNATLKARDGRRFNVRVMALSRNEAISQINQKFPLTVVTQIHRARVATARRIGGRLSRTAGRISRTAERIEKFLEGPDEENGGESLL